MTEAWLHPGLATGWGAASLVVLVALIAGLRRRLRPTDAAFAAMLSLPFGLGFGLLAFAIRDCQEPTGSYDERTGREFANCEVWMTHREALVPALLAITAGALGALLLGRTVRGVRRGARTPLNARSFLRLLVASIATFLLASQGAQIVAAPITVPSMLWLIAGARLATAVALTSVAALTMLFVGWLVTYSAAGESLPLSIVGPCVFAGATVTLFVRRYRKALASNA